jgi:transposase
MDKKVLEKLISQGKSTHQIASEVDKGQTTVRYWLNKYDLKTSPTRVRGLGKNNQHPEGVRRWADAKENPCACCGELTYNRNTYCNMKCKANYDATRLLERWKLEGPSALLKRSRESGSFDGMARRALFIEYESKCAECGWTHDFGDGTLPPLDCAHIDGNYKNNNISNIRLLCPNCHAVETRLSPTKRGRGRWSNGDDTRNYKPL